jgi:hypothetical protein
MADEMILQVTEELALTVPPPLTRTADDLNRCQIETERQYTQQQQRRNAEAYYGGLIQMANAWRRMHLPHIKPCSKCGK